MAEALSYTGEIQAVTCDTCPLRDFTEDIWRLLARHKNVDPLSMGMYVGDIIADVRRTGMPEPDEELQELAADMEVEPSPLEAVDRAFYFETPLTKQEWRTHTTLFACFQMNAAHECPAAQPALPELTFSRQTILDGLQQVVQAGNNEQVEDVAARVRGALHELADKGVASEQTGGYAELLQLNDRDLLWVVNRALRQIREADK